MGLFKLEFIQYLLIWKKENLQINFLKKLKKKSQKNSIPISCSSVRKYSIRMWRMTKVNLSFYSGWFISWSLFGVYKINTCVNLLLKLILILLVFFIKKDDWLYEYTVFFRLCRYLIFIRILQTVCAKFTWGVSSPDDDDPCMVFTKSTLVSIYYNIHILLYWRPIFFFTLLIHRYHNLSPNTIKLSYTL